MTRIWLLVSVMFLIVWNGAVAETALDTCQKQIFEHLDKNKDGVLSSTEAAARPMQMNAQFFAMSDSNGDGVLEFEEYMQLGMFVDCEVCPAAPGCAKGQ